MSPIVIRFGGDIEPPLPIDNSIGIEYGMVWRKPIAVETQTVLAEAASHIGIQFDVSWTLNNGTEQTIIAGWASKASEGISYGLSWKVLPQTRNDFAISWALPTSHQTSIDILWKTTISHQTDTVMRWLDVAAERLSVSVIWHDGAAQHIQHTLRYKGMRCGTEHLLKWAPHAARWICSTKYRPPVGVVSIRFNDPFTPLTSAAVNPIIIRFTPSPEYCYFDDGGGLIDANPVLPTIDFKIPIEPQIRRSYLMQPQISCVRVSDGAVVVLKSVSISRSRGQWASSGSLTFSSRIDALRAADELLKITINGYDLYLLCESSSETRAFGSASYSTSGRGRLALLSAPYQKSINYMNTVSRSFIGLMSDVIVNTGWTIVSEITDFTVPANAFSYAAKTPAEAISLMASAVGAMLDIDDETQTITVIPQWPTVPWDTESAVPDVIIHDSVILDFSERREIRPDANAVFVRGEQQGVAAKVKRSGTAGDNFAADIVDKLITDNQAARMRATAELSNAGNKVQSVIRTKVMADLPPIRPGMLVVVRKGVDVFKSVCDSFTITASVNESTGVVSVNQTVTLLRNEVAA
ncbi:hypothetical protein [Shewanella glacialimarina]|uniref:hypothetical protein n=1 Tax=Shewanella glacialimarina TaxID=2590884 RepID=UPI001CF9017C|nr:hypothetical protein [Shewanella glacialimarina]